MRSSTRDLYSIEIPNLQNDGMGSANSRGSKKGTTYDNILSPDKFDRMEAELAIQRETEKVSELMTQLSGKEKEITRLRTAIDKYESENKSMINETEELKIENSELKS